MWTKSDMAISQGLVFCDAPPYNLESIFPTAMEWRSNLSGYSACGYHMSACGTHSRYLYSPDILNFNDRHDSFPLLYKIWETAATISTLG